MEKIHPFAFPLTYFYFFLLVVLVKVGLWGGLLIPTFSFIFRGRMFFVNIYDRNSEKPRKKIDLFENHRIYRRQTSPQKNLG